MAPRFDYEAYRRRKVQNTQTPYKAFARNNLPIVEPGIPDGVASYPPQEVLDTINAYDYNATLPPMSEGLRSPYMDIIPQDFAAGIPDTPMNLDFAPSTNRYNNLSGMPNNTSTSKGKMANIEGLGDYYATMLSKESSGNYGIVNSKGYLGGYQMREGSLIDAGLVKPGTTKKGLDNPDNWYNDLSKEKFLASPDIQDAAVRTFTDKNKKYLGAVYTNATEIERRGLLASAHLIGAGQTKKDRKRKDGVSSVDGNGISGQDYYDYFTTH